MCAAIFIYLFFYVPCSVVSLRYRRDQPGAGLSSHPWVQHWHHRHSPAGSSGQSWEQASSCHTSKPVLYQIQWAFFYTAWKWEKKESEVSNTNILKTLFSWIYFPQKWGEQDKHRLWGNNTGDTNVFFTHTNMEVTMNYIRCRLKSCLNVCFTALCINKSAGASGGSYVDALGEVYLSVRTWKLEPCHVVGFMFMERALHDDKTWSCKHFLRTWVTACAWQWWITSFSFSASRFLPQTHVLYSSRRHTGLESHHASFLCLQGAPLSWWHIEKRHKHGALWIVVHWI